LRGHLREPAMNIKPDLDDSGVKNTQREMVKDEDVCLHCGVVAERCPTGAWDMKKSFIDMTHAGESPVVLVAGLAAAATGAAAEMATD
jgi:NAD-dependent dihydropyrimidine dehydrogenase PreA subunit